MKKFLVAILLIAVAGTVGWHLGRQSHTHPESNGNGRKIAYYQSAMHPWIKSDKPGNCTICGMKLMPVYVGEKGFDIEGNLVSLSSNAISVLNVQTAPAELHAIERQLNVAGKIEAQESRYKMLAAYADGR